MKRFVAVLTAVLIGSYAYLAWRLTATAEGRLALPVPLLLVWIIPTVYWIGGRERARAADEIVRRPGSISSSRGTRTRGSSFRGRW